MSTVRFLSDWTVQDDVELWFNNTDTAGCVAWDSCYGRNYWLDVVAA